MRPEADICLYLGVSIENSITRCRNWYSDNDAPAGTGFWSRFSRISERIQRTVLAECIAAKSLPNNEHRNAGSSCV